MSVGRGSAVSEPVKAYLLVRSLGPLVGIGKGVDAMGWDGMAWHGIRSVRIS